MIEYQRICHIRDWLWHSVITFLNQSCLIPVSTILSAHVFDHLVFSLNNQSSIWLLIAYNLIDESFSSSSLVMYVFSTPVIRHLFAGFYIWLWSYYFLNTNHVFDCFDFSHIFDCIDIYIQYKLLVMYLTRSMPH